MHFLGDSIVSAGRVSLGKDLEEEASFDWLYRRLHSLAGYPAQVQQIAGNGAHALPVASFLLDEAAARQVSMSEEVLSAILGHVVNIVGRVTGWPQFAVILWHNEQIVVNERLFAMSFASHNLTVHDHFALLDQLPFPAHQHKPNELGLLSFYLDQASGRLREIARCPRLAEQTSVLPLLKRLRAPIPQREARALAAIAGSASLVLTILAIWLSHKALSTLVAFVAVCFSIVGITVLGKSPDHHQIARRRSSTGSE